MLFRPATLEDARDISTLVQSLSQGFVLNPDGSGAEQFWASVSQTAEASYITSPGYSFTIAFAGSEIAGFIAMRDISHVFHLFVAPRFQRKGLASRLWAHAKAFASQSGHIGAFTVNSSLTAAPIYEHFGFTPISEAVKVHGISFIPMHLQAAHSNACPVLPLGTQMLHLGAGLVDHCLRLS